MSENLQLLKDACAYIEARGERGTGYLVAPGWVVTCAHVVREVGPAERVHVRFPDVPEAEETWALVTARDEINDCALLRLEAARGGGGALPIAPGCAAEEPFLAYGFPRVAGDHPVGVTLRGTVSDPGGRDPGGGAAVVLFCKEAAAGQGGPLHGFSGSPVLVGGALVGHLKQVIPGPGGRAELGLVYACPSRHVEALLPGGRVPHRALRWIDAGVLMAFLAAALHGIWPGQPRPPSRPAPEEVRLAGLVVGEDDQPRAGVELRLAGCAAAQQVLPAATDPSGRFTLGPLPEGCSRPPYKIQYLYEGRWSPSDLPGATGVRLRVVTPLHVESFQLRRKGVYDIILDRPPLDQGAPAYALGEDLVVPKQSPADRKARLITARPPPASRDPILLQPLDRASLAAKLRALEVRDAELLKRDSLGTPASPVLRELLLEAYSRQARRARDEADRNLDERCPALGKQRRWLQEIAALGGSVQEEMLTNQERSIHRCDGPR